MRILLFFILFLNFSFAGIFDIFYINKAEKFAKEGSYKEAIEQYAKLDNDEAIYNIGVMFYKEGNFSEAIARFSEVNSTNLEFEKLHNIGNSYANLGELEKGIKSYEQALSIRDDNDTRYNLELLKEEQKKQQQEKENGDKEDKQDKQDKNKDKEEQTEENKEKQEKKKDQEQKGQDKEEQKKNSEQNQQNQQNQESDQDNSTTSKNNKEDEEKQKEELETYGEGQETKSDNSENVAITEHDPMIDLEESKWQRILNNRNVNTLILPLDNQREEKDEEKLNPW